MNTRKGHTKITENTLREQSNLHNSFRPLINPHVKREQKHTAILKKKRFYHSLPSKSYPHNARSFIHVQAVETTSQKDRSPCAQTNLDHTNSLNSTVRPLISQQSPSRPSTPLQPDQLQPNLQSTSRPCQPILKRHESL